MNDTAASETTKTAEPKKLAPNRKPAPKPPAPKVPSVREYRAKLEQKLAIVQALDELPDAERAELLSAFR